MNTLACVSACVADLTTGHNLNIMEVNGAEPAHIYQPGFSIYEACRILFHHWTGIGALNHKFLQGNSIFSNHVTDNRLVFGNRVIWLTKGVTPG